MSAIPISLGTLRAVSVRLLHPWRGAWVADVDVDADDTATVPTSGAVVLTIGDHALSGTVDPRNSGRFGAHSRVRVVAGAGAWDQVPPRQLFSNDAGVLSTTVYQSTARAVGETLVDDAPVTLGVQTFERSGARPASHVFGDRDWWVGLDGVTHTAARAAATPDPSTEVLGYEPASQRLELASDAVVMPGTVLTDARFDGPLTIRTVEQTFAPAGVRAIAWCSSSPVERLMTALSNLVRELGGRSMLRTYRMRFVSAGPDGRVTLQAVDPAPGIPDGGPITVWPGIAGASAKYTPGQLLRIAFFNGDPSLPFVAGADGTLPLEATIDAKTALHLGPHAQSIDMAGGSTPIARVGDQVLVFLPPGSIPVSGTVSGSPFTGTITILNPMPCYGTIQSGSPKVGSA